MFRAMHLFLRAKSRAAWPTSSGFVNHFSTASNSESCRLAGKVAVITGAASGIGKATAAEFVRHGAKVILSGIQDDLGRSVAAELGPQAAYTPCDVTDEAQVAAAIDLAVARHGRLDILHNNAGILVSDGGSALSSLDLAVFDRTMAVNARAVVAGVKHAARVMVPRRSGCILFTASVAGILGSQAPHGYSISKAAVIGLVRSVAGELARHGVRVNAIPPYSIPTPLVLNYLAKIYPEASNEVLKRMVMDLNELEGTVLDTEDIARAAVYLASDEAKSVTGHNLVVDGGYSVGKPVNLQIKSINNTR